MFQDGKIMQVHGQLRNVLEALQMHAQHPSYIPLGLLQIIFAYVLKEMGLFSQTLPTLDIYHQQSNISLYSHDH